MKINMKFGFYWEVYYMREIKLRGINRIGKMVYGTGIFKDKVNTWLLSHDNSKPLAYGFDEHLIQEDSIMQYTGVKDINGKEIYEGDIVRFLDEVIVKEEGYLDRTAIVDKIGVVAWDNEELGYNIDTKYPNEHHYLCCSEEVKVIGNIYENIDLLK